MIPLIFRKGPVVVVLELLGELCFEGFVVDFSITFI